MTIFAVDPGLSGAIAMAAVGGSLIEVAPMPESEAAIAAHFYARCGRPWIAYVEDVPLIVSTGPKQNAASRAKLHANAGFIRGVLSLGTVHKVLPRTWQGGLGLRNTDKLPYADWKKVLKERAQAEYPGVKVTLKTADALLILKYALLNDPCMSR